MPATFTSNTRFHAMILFFSLPERKPSKLNVGKRHAEAENGDDKRDEMTKWRLTKEMKWQNEEWQDQEEISCFHLDRLWAVCQRHWNNYNKENTKFRVLRACWIHRLAYVCKILANNVRSKSWMLVRNDIMTLKLK